MTFARIFHAFDSSAPLFERMLQAIWAPTPYGIKKLRTTENRSGGRPSYSRSRWVRPSRSNKRLGYRTGRRRTGHYYYWLTRSGPGEQGSERWGRLPVQTFYADQIVQFDHRSIELIALAEAALE